MSWIAKDDFESYTISNDLDTLNGGSGWSGAWAKQSGVMTVQASPAGFSGNNVIKCAESGSEYRRLLSSVSAGTMSFLFQVKGISSLGDFWFGLGDSVGVTTLTLVVAGDGNIKVKNGAAEDTIQAWSLDTTYKATFDWNDAAQPDKYRVKIDAGSYTAYKDVPFGGTLVGVTSFQPESRALFSASGEKLMYFDDIKSEDRRWILGPH